AVHHLKRGADIGRKVDLVDDEQIRARDARAALGRNLVTGGDIDDIDGDVGELRRKRRGEIVAAGFDQDEIKIWKFLPHLGDRGEIDRGVFANGGVRAAAGLDAGDALGGERT